ncbi:MAG: amidohydrolase [Gemmatimonadaceae bacterium]|nr:amidohydrolase [Gemmatimonadaceae bacterium]
MTTSRREFLGQLGGLAFAGLPAERPDTVLYNGHIITVDRSAPRAQAIAISGDRIAQVGDNARIRALAGRGTRLIDLGGKTVVPGFIDAHSHPAYSGLQHLRAVDADLRSIAAIQAAVRERAARTPKGEWVLGFKYDDTKTSEGRYLTREDLDAATKDHPVYIVHRGGHSAYVNSLAITRAGVTEQTADPDGGKFDRDSAGRMTGRVVENATGAFDRVIPSTYTRADYQNGVKLISKMLAKAGVTSVHDAYGDPADLRAYQDAHQAGELATRVYCLIGYGSIDRMIAAGVRTGFGDEWVRIGAMKATCDGSISERTARLSQAYIGRPDDFGIIVADTEKLYPPAKKAHDAGWQIGIHANGDVGIGMVLDLYERLQRENPRRDPRFRIEHCTVINPTLVGRMKALGVIPNPFSTYVYFHGEKMRYYGAERLESMFAVRSFLDAGLLVTQTSDYPPGPFEPMMALQSSVTRTDIKGNVWGRSQRVTVEEAIRVGTLNGAHASFEERIKGSIEAGKLADLVVLGRNPLREDPMSIITIPIERTMVGGRWVYES